MKNFKDTKFWRKHEEILTPLTEGVIVGVGLLIIYYFTRRT
jgi:hypothetical protein